MNSAAGSGARRRSRKVRPSAVLGVVSALLAASCGSGGQTIEFDGPMATRAPSVSGSSVTVDTTASTTIPTSVPSASAPASDATPDAVSAPSDPSEPPSTDRQTSGSSLIEWNGATQYIHGANLPWVNYGCDFGCGADGGASSPEVQEIVRTAFDQATDAGMTHVRWWLFPDLSPHVVTDERGFPLQFVADVYRDLDAALLLAEAADLDLVLTLFAGPTEIPRKWFEDPMIRTAAMNLLRGLFERYADHPRIMTWQVMNEPEWAIWNGDANAEFVQSFVADVAETVHRTTSALVSIGGARLDGIGLWTDLGLDYLTVHWYDNMVERGECLPCTTYDELVDEFDIDVPVLVGEFYLGGDAAFEKLARFRERGFAGSLGWSLMPQRTFDQLAIDFDVSLYFAASLKL